MSPCNSRAVSSLGSGPEPELAEPLSQPRILIAEDDPYLAEDLMNRLETLEYTVAGAVDSAEQAVRFADTSRPDLVLMDIQLAGQMDGIHAAEAMREIHIPVVYVTGYINSLVLNRAMRTDPSGYVLKPYETSDLQHAIQTAFQKRRREREREATLRRLQEALSGVKTLTGRLSICCYCKRIKDAAGNWPEVETYIMQHSYATFTHGMCPHCFARMKQQLAALESGSTGPELILG